MPGPAAPAAHPLARVGLVLVLLVLLGLTLVGRAAPARAAAPAGEAGAPIAAGRADGTTESAEPATTKDYSALSPVQAVVLGVVEGLTEFLPVSSTGHLTVLERLFGISVSESTKEAADAYAIVIQAGAILAVVVLYHQRILSVAKGVVGRDDDGRAVLISLLVSFLPAAVIGFVFEKPIKEHLLAPWPVVLAWTVGGVVLLVLSSKGWWERERHGADLVSLSIRSALIIGVAQCLAMWPGTSRSLVTIVAALLVGLSLNAAVEYSFLLGLVTLGAATAYDTIKHGNAIIKTFGVLSPTLGFVAAFLAAVIAVRWMVGYLQNHSLAIFGWYRLGIAALTTGLLLANVI